jgi:hypothetical protein
MAPGVTELVGGGCHAAQPGGSFEGAQGVQGWQAAFHHYVILIHI